MQVFIDYLGDYVQSAGGGVDAEKYGLRHTEYEYEADKIQPNITHHRSGPWLNEILVRIDPLPEVYEWTENECGIGRLYSELATNQEVGEYEQEGVDDDDDGGDLDADAYPCKQFTHNDREARNRTIDQVARD